MKLGNWLMLFGCVVACESVGIAGSLATRSEIGSWYASLAKPSFNPPSWIFGPVWTTLYAMMGAALFLVLRQGLARAGVRLAAGVFVGQLLLNGSWSWVFFGMHSMGGGLVIIIVLLAMIILTIWRFAPISATAAWLLVPYALWVAFAAVLNAGIFRLNQ